MPTVSLLARDLRTAPFWSSVVSHLIREHKDIDRTISTSADLTLPQYNNLSFFFISKRCAELDSCTLDRCDDLCHRGRRVVVITQGGNRNWEQIQLQFTLAGLAITILPATTSISAAACVHAFVSSLTSKCHAYPDTHASIELLYLLDLSADKLELLFFPRLKT